MKYTLPNLTFTFSDLEPYIDTKTMELHYLKHHQTYIDKLNEALSQTQEIINIPLEKLLTNTNLIPDAIKTKVINNGGGHFNHSFYWSILSPSNKYQIPSTVLQEINSTFESLENFKKLFKEAGLGQFGSGWVWLVKNNSKLEIVTTPNQNTTLEINKTPILGIDLWEHAYYLKYQNRRGEYLDNIWNVINWNQVEQNLLS